MTTKRHMFCIRCKKDLSSSQMRNWLHRAKGEPNRLGPFCGRKCFADWTIESNGLQPIRVEKKLRDTVRSVAQQLATLERRLHEVGLIKTAHQLNAVTKELGWEAAEKLT